MTAPQSNPSTPISGSADPNETVVRELHSDRIQEIPFSESVINTWTVTESNPNDTEIASDALPAPESNFLLIRSIGKGGFGEVWEAVQTSLGRIVAVKRIQNERMEKAGEDSQLARVLEYRFRQEAAVTAQLDHPNILPVYDFGTDHKGRSLLAMKLVRGRPWHEVLQEDFRELPVDQYLAKHLPRLIAMSQAVAFAHSRGIVHRDLKASQVMVGEFGEVLLMDWGLAIRVEKPEGSVIEEMLAPHLQIPTLLNASSPAGTPSLMAPEQTREDASEITYRTDVYLLGGTLYYLLTGTYPHLTASSEEAFKKARAGVIEEPHKRAPDRVIPSELADLAMRALRRNPAERVRSAEDFVIRLQDYLSGASSRKESGDISESVEKDFRALESRVRAGGTPGSINSAKAYETLSDCLARLDHASALWQKNPQISTLRPLVLEMYTEIAIEKNDLSLARLMIGNMRRDDLQAPFLQKVAKKERKVNASRRQRQAAIGFASVMAMLLGFVTVRYLRDQEYANLQLGLQRDRALAARASEERQRLLAQEEQYFSALGIAEITLEQGRVDKTRDTLFEKTPELFRNWEWGWLLGRLNPDVFNLDSEGNYHASFSPDGSRLITGMGRGIRMWDAKNGDPIWESSTNDALIFTTAYSPDGTVVAGASRDSTAVILDAEDGSLVHRLVGHTAFLRGIAFTPDGKQIATTSNDQTVRLWDVESGALIRVIDDFSSGIFAIDFKTGGSRAVTGAANGRVTVWDTTDWTIVLEVQGLSEKVLSARYFPDGERILTGSTSRNTTVVNAETGEILKVFPNVNSYIHFADVSPDGKMVATADDLGVMVLWDVESGLELARVQLDDPLYKVHFHPDGRRIFAVARRSARMIGLDHILGASKRTEVTNPQDMSQFEVRLHPFSAREDYDKLWDERERLWNVPSGATVASNVGREVLVTSRFVDFSPDYTRKVTIDRDTKHARLSSTDDGAEIATLGENEVFLARYSPNGRVIATGEFGEDGIVRLWDGKTGDPIRIFDPATAFGTGDSRLYGLAFSPDGRSIVVGHYLRGILAEWDIKTGKFIREFPNAEDMGATIVFSKDGKRLASGALNDSLAVWDTDKGTLISTMIGHQRPVMAAAFSPDGTRLASAANDGTVKIWDVRNGREILTVQSTGRNNLALALGFSESGRDLYVIDTEGDFSVYEAFPWQSSDYPGTAEQPMQNRVELWKRRERLWKE